MKDLILEYIELSDVEKSELCENATIVFDTNVFLNLYRYSNDTRNLLLDIMEKISHRIWIPAQVIVEFMKNRYDVIFESINRYEKLVKEGDAFVNNCIEQLRIQESSKEVDEIKNYLHKWLDNHKDKNLLVIDNCNDVILNKLLILLTGKVGDNYPAQEYDRIVKEGEDRYKNKIPPGYKDSVKTNTNSDNNAYGDLLIWKQILKYASDNQKDVIFVTHDQKDDWWNINHGKTIGPRVELRKEYYKETKKRFHMYTMNGFIERFAFNDHLDSKIAFEIKSLEVKTSESNDNMRLTDVKQVVNLVNKYKNVIYKQKSYIKALENKYGTNMPENIRIQHKNTIKNIRLNEINLMKLIENNDNINLY